MAAEVDSDPFGPLSEEEERALADAVLARLGKADTAAAIPTPALAPVVQLPTRKVRVWPMVAAALSVAAAALVVFWPRAELSELPAYALVLPPPDASHRDAQRDAEPVDELPAGELRTYVLGRELELLLRPATRVEQGVVARAFVERDEGKLEPLAVEPVPVPGGAIMIRLATGKGTRLSEAVTTRLHFVLAPSEMAWREIPVLTAMPKDVQHLSFGLRLITESALDSVH